MNSLYNYIFESIKSTASNKERKDELEKWLKNKKYSDYVDILNKMLEDPKSASLLKDGFGGVLGNMKLKFSVTKIQANKLLPTQHEIDVNLLKHCLQKIDVIKKDIENPVIIANMPIITFNKKYVIDGHHRWIEPMTVNPDAEMLCFNYDGDISPMKMLKAVQGTIAAVIANKNHTDEKLPSGKVKGDNIFKMSNKEIRKYLEENINDDIINFISNNILSNNDNNVINYLLENIINLQKHNSPSDDMPKRDDMPQTDKGGTDRDNKQTSKPDIEGSALNKLKTGKIYKNIL